MSRRESRFEKLERRRTQSAPAEKPAARGRFEAIEAPAEMPEAGGLPPASGERFRPAEERPPEVETGREGAQPFVRCARCESDNTVYAGRCVNCQADLDTPEQRAYNERLWTARREEAAREERELARQRQAQASQSAEEARTLRAAAEAMAREVGERERERLDRALGSGGGSFSVGPPLGIVLLCRVQSPLLRGAIIAISVGVPALLALLGARRAAVIVFVLALTFFLSPNRFRSRF